MALLLLQKGADTRTKNHRGWTPLHFAADTGHHMMIRELLQYGANIGAKNQLERTPLHLAAKGGHEQATQDLLANGADIFARDKGGETPLDIAHRNGHKRVGQILKLGVFTSVQNHQMLGKGSSSNQETPVPMELGEVQSDLGQIMVHHKLPTI